MTTVSVVMTTYNGARFVERQLATILGQTVLPTELLIGDDGSSDGTVEIVTAALARAPLVCDVRVNETRLGVTANFEVLLRRATGDIVLLSDQDDEWAPDKIELVVATMAANPRVSGVFSDGSLIGSASEHLPGSLWRAVGFDARRRRSFASDPFATLMRGNVVTGATLALRTSAMEQLLPLSPHGWHDHWIAALLTERRSLLPIPRPLVRYRLHGSNHAGLPPRGVERFRLPDRRDSHPRMDQLRQLHDLADHLRVHERVPPTALLERIDHLTYRKDLPALPRARIGAVVRRLPRGDYWRFASGLRSVAYDLVAAERRVEG